MSAPTVVQRTAWLFTRGEASVSMTVDHHADGASLTVRGPGSAHASYDFPDMSRLGEFADAQEQRLQSEGFQLQAVTERRSRDRDQSSRASQAERRR